MDDLRAMAADLDPKQVAILDSAWRAFAAYGYRKTSMDDIARGAGMSRPALYLRYKNKEAIYRSLTQLYYDTTLATVTAALQAPGPVRDRVSAAFAAQAGELVEAMLSSPHGVELMDTGHSVARDIAEAGEAALAGVYAGWLSAEDAAGRVRLPGAADQIAATITTALKGLKMAGVDYATYRARVMHLAALVGAGLTAT